ncbi:hypothetical protein Sjap_013644 [Stephania japonica]|uniref:Uncharacterized protein n=1 Tax=Stephania japonica TaxID=461633 RepID=A0AAP0NXV2_9MAGN
MTTKSQSALDNDWFHFKKIINPWSSPFLSSKSYRTSIPGDVKVDKLLHAQKNEAVGLGEKTKMPPSLSPFLFKPITLMYDQLFARHPCVYARPIPNNEKLQGRLPLNNLSIKLEDLILTQYRNIAREEPSSSFRTLGGLCPSDAARVLRHCPERASVLFPYAPHHNQVPPMPKSSSGNDNSNGNDGPVLSPSLTFKHRLFSSLPSYSVTPH